MLCIKLSPLSAFSFDNFIIFFCSLEFTLTRSVSKFVFKKPNLHGYFSYKAAVTQILCIRAIYGVDVGAILFYFYL